VSCDGCDREFLLSQELFRIFPLSIETAKDTLENWQSEFVQLAWQVGGLAFFFFVGSPQSKEGDDRREAKLDIILSKSIQIIIGMC
jgi:hypothetical protein